MNEILEKAESYKVETVSCRRRLHSMPEASFEEHQTAAFIAGKLAEFGYSVKTGIAGTGIIAEMGEGPTIALRAELDGLKIGESNPIDYVSQKPGLSHACGHDANMAVVLTAARILAELETTKNTGGCIRIIMQPASELASDENMLSGADRMIEEGAIENLEAILGLHMDSTIKAGHIGIIKEPVIPRSDRFELSIGPSQTKNSSDWNALYAGARIISALEEADTGSNNPENSILIQSLQAQDEKQKLAKIEGLINFKSRDMLEHFKTRLNTATRKVLGDRGIATLQFGGEAPKNMDNRIVEKLHEASNRIVGEDRVVLLKRKTWSEDFSIYSSRMPAAMALFGGQLPGQPRVAHTQNFDLDDSHLYLGAAVLADAATHLLNLFVEQEQNNTSTEE